MKKITRIIILAILAVCVVTMSTKLLTIEAAEYSISNPKIEEGITTWDCIYFGHYWQNNYEPENSPEEPKEDTIYIDTDGTEFFYDVIDGNYYKNNPIKWRVLSVNGDDAFLLADQILYDYFYDYNIRSDVTWETSTLRSWLNNSFYNYAFFASERDVIISTLVKSEDNAQWCTGNGNNTNDKIYILSFDDVTNPLYGFNGGYKESETRVSQKSSIIGASDRWWIRTQGSRNWSIMYINNRGGVQMSGEYSGITIGIRPCMHIDLSKATWTKATSVNAEVGEVVQIPTTTSTQNSGSAQTVPPTNTKKPVITTSEKTVKSEKVTIPSKPTKIKVKNKKKKTVIVSWKKVKGAKGYQVQYAANTTFSKKKVKNTKKTKLVIKKLKKKKTYCFRVRAYKTSNGVKKYSKWSKVKKVKIKK